MWRPLIFCEVLRSLKYRPRDVLFCVGVLSIGIAASSVAFSIVSETILTPLAFPNASQIVELFQPEKENGIRRPFTYRFFYDARHQLPGIKDLAALSFSRVVVQHRGERAVAVDALSCSASLFRLLRLSPTIGRTFDQREENSPGVSVALLSEQFWKSEYNGSPKVIGEELSVNGKPFIVIGVLPHTVRIPPLASSPSIWIPLDSDPMIDQLKKMFASTWDRSAYLTLWARLEPGVSLAVAEQRIQNVAAPLLAQDDLRHSSDYLFQIASVEDELRSDYRLAMYLLISASVLTLLVASSNMSSIMIARAQAKRNEISIRQVFGEHPALSLVRLLLDPILGTITGWLVSVPISVITLRAIGRILPADTLPFQDFAINGEILVSALSLSLIFTLATTIFPACRIAYGRRTRLHGATRTATEDKPTRASQNLIVITQVICGMVALSLFFSLFEVYQRVSALPLGFNPQNILTVDLTLPQTNVSGQHWKSLIETVGEDISGVPGVLSAAPIVSAPLTPSLHISYSLLGKHVQHQSEIAEYRPVGPDYFSILHVPILKGRSFEPSDRETDPSVCIVNQTLARISSPDSIELGGRLGLLNLPTCEVVGIVGDVASSDSTKEPEPTIYVPFDQMPNDAIQGFLALLVKVGDRNSEVKYHTQQIRHVFEKLAPTLPFDLRELSAIANERLSPERFRAAIMSFVSFIALILSACSIYGVTANHIVFRRRALTIRLVFGATKKQVIAHVMRHALKLAFGGIVAGFILVYALLSLFSGFIAGLTGQMLALESLFAACIITLIVSISAFIASTATLRLDTAEVLKEA